MAQQNLSFWQVGEIILSEEKSSKTLPLPGARLPEDQNNSSETRLCKVSDKIILVGEWNFFVPHQYIMMDTFSHPPCDCFRIFGVASLASKN